MTGTPRTSPGTAVRASYTIYRSAGGACQMIVTGLGEPKENWARRKRVSRQGTKNQAGKVGANSVDCRTLKAKGRGAALRGRTDCRSVPRPAAGPPGHR